MKLKMLRRFGAFIMVVILAVSMTAVSAMAEEETETPSVDVSELRIEPNKTQTIAVNGTVKFTAEPKAQDGVSIPTEPLVWALQNPSSKGIVSLKNNSDNTCTVAGISPGRVTVVVATKDGGHSASCQLDVTGIVLDASTLTLVAGRTANLTANTYGNAPKSSEVVWTSSNISVAEVDGGRVTAHYPGTAVITAAAGSYTATCKVTVKEDAAEAINVSAGSGETLAFSELVSTLNRRSGVQTQSNLKYINSLQVLPEQGVLYYGYASPYSPGSGVGSENYYVDPDGSQLDLSKVYFVPNTDFSGTAVISYTGRGENGLSFRGIIRVAVASVEDVCYSTSVGQPVYFATKDFLAVCQTKLGRDIKSITFSQPASNKGILYYNYGAASVYNPEVSRDVSFYSTKAPYIDDVVFVPEQDYEGTVTITYNCTTSSGSYTGKVTIRVEAAEQDAAGRITYDVTAGGQLDLEVTDFNQLCSAQTGSNLSYVYFDLPRASEGTLYYNYNSSSSYGGLVSDSTRYFRTSSPRIAYITFVPASGYSGTVYVPFTAYSANGNSFSSEIVIRVSGSSGVVSYSANYGESVYFEGADFNEACLDITGKSLDYVCFEQPSSSRGTLYRSTGYGSRFELSSSMKFYRNGGAHKIDDVLFVPNSSYTGVFDIPFVGYDTAGSKINGVVQITVNRQTGDSVVTYLTVSGGFVEFDADDFNEACRAITGAELSYVRFDKTSGDGGRLYYNYNSVTGTGNGVYTSTGYYRAASGRLLNEITFRASKNYTGVQEISYTGVTTGGKSYTGLIEITVEENVSVSVDCNGSSLPIQLKATDFEAACSKQAGRKLSYIRFTELPDATEGTLYLDYATPMRPGTAVETETSYYLNGSPSIGKITFVPRAGYQGDVNIPFAGVDTSGHSISGILKICISDEYAPNTFTDMTYYVTERPSVEFLYNCGVVDGYGNGLFAPSRDISRGEFMVMLYRAFELPDASSNYSFVDVPVNIYYAPAIAAAKRLGIAQGYGDTFMPQDTITRQDAMTLVQRAMEAMGRSVPNVSTSILSSFVDGEMVADYAKRAASVMVYIGAVEANDVRQLRPYMPITRAEMAVLLHYVLTQ